MTLDLKDNNTFETVLKICIWSYIILTMITNYILRKKGVNIYSTKNTLKIGLAFSPIIILPMWVGDMKSPIMHTLIARVLLSLFSAAVGIAAIYGIRYSGMRYRRFIGHETAEDKRVWAADEQAKKEKEERWRAQDRIKYGEQGPPPFLVFLRKNSFLLILSIIISSFIVGTMYIVKYPFNIVFSVLLFLVPVVCYIEQRHNEKKEKREEKR